ncbi:MAG: AAA family ATPase [Patescibacteria group bacterium]|jgi:nicotinamide riboside kinase
MKKVAIIGTFSTGKTTLTRDLCKLMGKKAWEIDENVRDITRKKLKKESTGHLDPAEFLQLQEIFYEYQKEKVEKASTEIIIVDSAFSQFTHLACYSQLRPDLNHSYDKKTLSYWKELNKKEAKAYDFIIYCPNVLELEDDGFRPINHNFRNAVEKHYGEFGSSCTKNFFVVSGTPETRVKQVMKLLGE